MDHPVSYLSRDVMTLAREGLTFQVRCKSLFCLHVRSSNQLAKHSRIILTASTAPYVCTLPFQRYCLTAAVFPAVHSGRTKSVGTGAAFFNRKLGDFAVAKTALLFDGLDLVLIGLHEVSINSNRGRKDIPRRTQRRSRAATTRYCPAGCGQTPGSDAGEQLPVGCRPRGCLVGRCARRSSCPYCSQHNCARSAASCGLQRLVAKCFRPGRPALLLRPVSMFQQVDDGYTYRSWVVAVMDEQGCDR